MPKRASRGKEAGTVALATAAVAGSAFVAGTAAPTKDQLRARPSGAYLAGRAPARPAHVVRPGAAKGTQARRPESSARGLRATAAAALGLASAAAERRTRRTALGSFLRACRLSASGDSGPGPDLERFRSSRNATFTGMVFGYAVYYFTRLSFTYVALAMRKDLGLSMVQLGAISSLFPIAYMNSKFISGVLSDLLGSPVLIFSVGLMLTGFLNIAFAMGTSVQWFTLIWVLNGLFQGCGATPCNKMLVNWFPARSRGKWWSGWNASHNLGGFVIPLLAGGMAAAYGWRWGMVAPGVIAIAAGLVALVTMKDSPEKLGLPTAEEYACLEGGDDEVPLEPEECDVDPGDEMNTPIWKILLRNKFLWCMSAMHFFIYFIRQGVLNWAHFYIMDHFGVSAVEATARVSGFELGGLLGCIASGQLSDWLISRNPDKGAAGLRTQVMIGYAALSTVSVFGLWVLPPVAAAQWLCMALFGFAIYGPQTLITMTGVETVPKRAAATAGGLLAYPAQFGSVCAGLPFAFLVHHYGWSGFFPSLVLLSIFSALVVLPGWNEPSYLQRRQRLVAA